MSLPLLHRPVAATRRRSRLRRSLELSIGEGIVSEIVAACSSAAVLTAWALYLRLPVSLIGVLGALPLAAQAFQLPGAWAAALFGDRRTALWAVGLSRQVPLALCALPFLPLPLQLRQAALLAVAALSTSLAVAGNNAWTSWMGELVPPSLRGRYFGRRTAFCALGAAGGALLAGVALDCGGSGSLDLSRAGASLSLLTLVGCAAGGVTSLLLARQHALPAPHGGTPTLEDALSPLRSAPSRSLLYFQAAWSASSGISAAFYPLHMVATLQMGFTGVAAYTTLIAVARMFAAPLWGRLVDHAGARPVLCAAAFGLCLSPLVWIFPRPGFLWPLALDAVLCGSFTAAQGLSTFSLTLSLAEPASERRSFHVGAFAACGGLATGLGAGLGGAMLKRIPLETGFFGLSLIPAQVLFLLADGGRFVAALLALRVIEPDPARGRFLAPALVPGPHAMAQARRAA